MADRVRLVERSAEIALGAAFLSAIASRFGLWGTGDFAAFEAYTAQVNTFMPAWTIPLLARAATVLELALGVGLVVGFRRPWPARGAAILLAAFGIAMAISLGLKSPLDYSVFSASACAALLASRAPAPG